MNITYEIHDHPEDTDWQTDEPIKVLYRCEDGVPVEEIGRDGGEPEDNSFDRDWRWVAPALNAAYMLGKLHAFQQAADNECEECGRMMGTSNGERVCDNCGFRKPL